MAISYVELNNLPAQVLSQTSATKKRTTGHKQYNEDIDNLPVLASSARQIAPFSSTANGSVVSSLDCEAQIASQASLTPKADSNYTFQAGIILYHLFNFISFLSPARHLVMINKLAHITAANPSGAISDDFKDEWKIFIEGFREEWKLLIMVKTAVTAACLGFVFVNGSCLYGSSATAAAIFAAVMASICLVISQHYRTHMGRFMSAKAGLKWFTNATNKYSPLLIASTLAIPSAFANWCIFSCITFFLICMWHEQISTPLLTEQPDIIGCPTQVTRVVIGVLSILFILFAKCMYCILRCLGRGPTAL